MLAHFPSSLCWQVQVQSHACPRSRLISFRDNLYFWNTVIVKEYYVDISGKCGSQGGRCGEDASSVAFGPVSPVFLQGIGHVVPPQSTGSGSLSVEHPATGWAQGAFNFSIGCLAATAQNQTGLLRWCWFGPAHS